MIKKNVCGCSVSALGFGCMRLPIIDGNAGKINMPLAAEMIDYAIKNGVNYFDTAWGYHQGQSEPAIGEILSKYPRNSFYLASKFPGYDNANMPKCREIFARQLERCRVDYFDFYLFHNVCESNIDDYLDDRYHIYDILTEKKKCGQIKHLGFSCHGDLPVLKRFLEAYGKDMEFCQLQINYLDWKFQNAEQKVALLNEYNIPVWVMEPVRGGRLVNLPEEQRGLLSSARPDASNAEWCFRFIQSIPEVGVTLSGMSDMEQVKENIGIFSEDKKCNAHELEILEKVSRNMLNPEIKPCTECRYCTTKCPKGLDIPRLIALYNEDHFSEGGFITPMALTAIEKDKLPNECISCHSCESVCPQKIAITEAMQYLAERM